MSSLSSSPTLTAPTASQLVFALTSRYSQFSFKLSTDGSKYKLWHRIFLDMCKGPKVHGHITGKSKLAGDDTKDWEAIDSRIKSWFYSTFDANLQEQFRNAKEGTSSVTVFCHNLKNLADALADCDSKIDEIELVMQILRQLPPSYHSIVDVITNTKPFPSFLEAKNTLLLHESREESIEPHTDMPFTSSAALYYSAHSTQNVSASSHSFAGNSSYPGHTQAFFGSSPTPCHIPTAQPGLLGAPPHTILWCWSSSTVIHDANLISVWSTPAEVCTSATTTAAFLRRLCFTVWTNTVH
ncbi:hypothetical protein OSB04_011439 [Centaurea solstitialis]|uniref:Uncharacterized protein n=1 Tax=Centaurea solstitialis TaxID=347529 RepID=A0AA38TL61_9ASTR|nr:hypothetical protein OSB04_011439 [Centaurea solstitialis]